MNRTAILYLTFLLYWVPVAGQYKLEKLASSINTKYNEISPIISPDGKTLYFTRVGSPDFQRTLFQYENDLSEKLNEQEYDNLIKKIYSQLGKDRVENVQSSSYNQDVWVSYADQGEFVEVFHPGFPLNNALPNSICAYSEPDQSLIIINQFGLDGSMYHGLSKTKPIGAQDFSFPEPLYIYKFYSNAPDLSANLSFDGDVLISALNRKDGLGDQDLYVSFILKPGVWSAPINLGPDINTSTKETMPYLSRDKKRLFFASDRKGGAGGTDIYVSRRIGLDWKSWTKPRKLFEPINSSADEGNPFYSEVDDYFYFVSTRDGSADIYRVNFSPERDINPRILVFKGKIIDQNSKEPLAAEINYTLIDRSKKSFVYRSYNGLFEVMVYTAGSIVFDITKPGYYAQSVSFTVSSLPSEDSIISLIVPMTPGQWQNPVISQAISAVNPPPDVAVTSAPPKEQSNDKWLIDKEIPIGKIYFYQNRPQIREDSYYALNRLVKKMQDEPGLTILIEGHTDDAGKPEDAQLLSEQRAKGIKEYLVFKGIIPDRIKTIGFGSSRPLNGNNTEEERKENRRVEIKSIVQQ